MRYRSELSWVRSGFESRAQLSFSSVNDGKKLGRLESEADEGVELCGET